MIIESSARSILGVLLTVSGVLLAAHVLVMIIERVTGVDYMLGLLPLFDLDKEKNIPTAYAALQLLLASIILLTIGVERKTRDQKSSYWIALSFLFAFLAFDEAFQVHERLINPLRQTYALDGAFHYAWTIPYGLATLIVVVVFAPFVRSLSARVSRLILMSGALYLVGALGFEMLGGYVASAGNGDTMAYWLITTGEEVLELVGIALFIYALLLYISERNLTFSLSIRD